jgi:hypothetical protein
MSGVAPALLYRGVETIALPPNGDNEHLLPGKFISSFSIDV